MSDDLDLFSIPAGTEPRARRSDPVTSHRAAAAARGWFKTHHGLMLKALVEHGEGTYGVIAERTGLTGWQVSRRLVELVRLGLIRDTGRVAASPNRQDAEIYEATDRGRDVVARGEDPRA